MISRWRLLPFMVSLGLAWLSTGPSPGLSAQDAGGLVLRVRAGEAANAVEGALATFHGPGTFQLRTNRSGEIQLMSIPTGEYRIEIRAPGFHPKDLMAEVHSGAPQTFQVALKRSQAPIELDPLTVTANRTALARLRTPASVSVREGEALATLQPKNLDDALGSLPNVTTAGGPRAMAQEPQIRGLGSSRIVLRVDGGRQNFQTGHKGRVLIEPGLLKRVEVVRGATSSLYGSGGLGGTIAMETRDAPDLLSAGEALALEVAPGLRGANDETSGLFAVAGRAGSADAMVAFVDRDGEDIRLSDGANLPFSAGEYRSWLAKVGIGFREGHRLGLQFRRFGENSVTPLNATTNTTDSTSLGDRSSDANSFSFIYDVADPAIPWLNVRAVGYREGSEVKEKRLSDGRSDTRSVSTLGFDLAGTARSQFSGWVGIALTAGFEYFNDENEGSRDSEALASFPDGDASFLGAFAQARIELSRYLSLVPGIRFDSYESASSNADNRANADSETQVKVAALVHPTPFLTLYANYAEGFNAPRLQDLYIGGMHFPSYPGAPFPSNFFVANPDLIPERADTYEGGFRLGLHSVLTEEDGVEAELTYFEIKATDFIAREVNLMGGTTTFQNLDEVALHGVEARVAYDAHMVFGALSFGRTRGHNITDDQPVDDMPADTWILDLGVKPFGGDVILGWRATKAADQNRVTQEDYETPGYTVHDASVHWTPPIGGLDLWLRVNNLFDVEHRRHGSALPAPARDFRIGATYRLGFVW